MRNKTNEPIRIPDRAAFEAELERLNYSGRYRSVLKSTIYSLIIVAAIAVLAATLFVPFLRIYGTSMTPTLENGDVVACIKSTDLKTGDVVAFYYNNKVLVKRVIAKPGDFVDIKKDGTVYVNGEKLEEPYLSEKAFGECDLELPYQVPESAYFVMGDHRATSMDSRHSSLGCVSEEQVVGKAKLRIWPLSHFGVIR